MEQIKEFTVKINTTKLLSEQGIKYSGFDNLLYYLQGTLYYLKTHNKNYTNYQYNLIETVCGILECMEG